MSDVFREIFERAKKAVEIASDRLETARLECDLAEGTYRHAQGSAARAYCLMKQIYPGPETLVNVDFSDGSQVCIFEDIEHSSGQPIVLRHFTSKNKPCASVSTYEWHLVKLMTPVAKPSKPA